MPISHPFRSIGAGTVVLLAACVSAPAADVPAKVPAAEVLSPWGERLAMDAQALHDGLSRNHPGAVDPLNPDFTRTNDAALELALSRAPLTADTAGWWWALREYAAAFNDAHLDVFLDGEPVSFDQQWAGFLTVWRAGEYIVATRDESLPEVPPIGARLIGCDGRTAADLAADRIGRFRGRWDMDSQKVTHAPWMFRDSGNPWTQRPQNCVFESEGFEASYPVTWYPVTLEEVGQRLDQVRPPMRLDIYLKPLEEGGYWIAMPDFTGDTNATLYPRLSALMDEIQANKEQLRAAPYVVLDVRDNGGGSSRWSEIVAEALWGADWLQAHAVPQATSVDWRASEENLAELEPYITMFEESGDAVMIDWITRVVSGLKAAREAGETYWIDASEEDAAPIAAMAEAQSLMQGKVFVLTDAACFSACLDAVDRWKAAGAVQIGQVTGGDTVYIENRAVSLPSGYAGYAQSMKVYRGRHRGNNEPHVPELVYKGNLGDDAAVEAWVAEIAAK